MQKFPPLIDNISLHFSLYFNKISKNCHLLSDVVPSDDFLFSIFLRKLNKNFCKK